MSLVGRKREQHRDGNEAQLERLLTFQFSFLVKLPIRSLEFSHL